MLRLPGFSVSTWRWQGRQSYAPAAFTPQGSPLVLIPVRGWGDSGSVVWAEGLSQCKTSGTPLGFQPPTFGCVAQCFYQVHYMHIALFSKCMTSVCRFFFFTCENACHLKVNMYVMFALGLTACDVIMVSSLLEEYATSGFSVRRQYFPVKHRHPLSRLHCVITKKVTDWVTRLYLFHFKYIIYCGVSCKGYWVLVTWLSMKHLWNNPDGETEVLKDKPVSVPHCPPEIWHGLAWNWTWPL
jgi:hypothetical protein